jgi:chromosome segregation protein
MRLLFLHLHLQQLQTQLALAEERSAQSQAQLQTLEDMAEEVESNRRQAQENSNQQTAKLVELQARQEALKALQEKLRTDERLTPWLNKHGLQNLQPLWNKLHITPGWEQALEAALRERLAALEVTRIDSVKAFAADVPMAKLSFYTPGVAVAAAPKPVNSGRTPMRKLLSTGRTFCGLSGVPGLIS